MFRITRIGVLAGVLLWATGCEPLRPLTQTGPAPQAATEKPPVPPSEPKPMPEAPVASGRPYDSVPLIPRRVLFGNPDRLSPKLSPDGSKLGFVAPVDDVLNVWVGPSDDPSSARPVTRDTHRGIRSFFFAYTNEHVVYIQDRDGDENWRVYAVDLEANETRELTPGSGVRAQIQEVSPRFPDEILIGLNDRDPRFHDLYRVNIRTGEKTRVQENEQFASFVTDEEFQVRFGMRITPDGGNELLRRAGDAWEPFLAVGPDDTLTTRPLGFDESGRTLFMLDSRNRNTAGLTAVNAETAETTLLFQDGRADVDRILRHPTRKTIQAVGANYLRPSWTFNDLRVQADFELLEGFTDGDVSVFSRSLDDRQWIVVIEVDDGPVQFHHFDRTQRKSHFLFTNNRALEDAALAGMHPVVIPARDGLELVSYLTLPVGTDEDEDGRPAEPLPLVLFVHGGPWGRDVWGYNAHHQWLANRGYAVLSVNFRGSTGFGKNFVNAGDREWAGKMHDDLIDAVQWAVETGVADPQRIAIMGGSYGGFATLVGLTFTPEVFACGVDIVGVSNILTWIESIPPYWAPLRDLFARRVGDFRTEEGRRFLQERSPLTHVDRIGRPLLIGQGANDPRVKKAESDQIVEAMQARNIPVTYVLYPDEGHGFARPPNRMSFNAVAEAFLAKHLGGRSEPFGDEFEGSSITVPAGAEEVAGLAETLRAKP